jgi:hypothetical protein
VQAESKFFLRHAPRRICDNTGIMLDMLIDDMVRSEPRGPIWHDERDLLFANAVGSISHEVEQLDLLWTCGHIGAGVARLCQGSLEGRDMQPSAQISAELLAATGIHQQGASLLLPAVVIEAINDWYSKLSRALYWASAELRRACATALMAGADLTMAGCELGTA